MKDLLIKIPFTAFIVAMIVLPLPPSTIIGLALASHPKTNRYMDPFTLKALFIAGNFMKKSFKFKVKILYKVITSDKYARNIVRDISLDI